MFSVSNAPTMQCQRGRRLDSGLCHLDHCCWAGRLAAAPSRVAAGACPTGRCYPADSGTDSRRGARQPRGIAGCQRPTACLPLTAADCNTTRLHCCRMSLLRAVTDTATTANASSVLQSLGDVTPPPHCPQRVVVIRRCTATVYSGSSLYIMASEDSKQYDIIILC